MQKIDFTVSVEFLPYKTKSSTRYYVRTRELAVACGIKQPFEFNRWLRKVGGDTLVEKGDLTKDYRNILLDTGNTTFVSLSEIIIIMRKYEKYLSKIAPNFYTVLIELEKFAKRKKIAT